MPDEWRAGGQSSLREWGWVSAPARIHSPPISGITRNQLHSNAFDTRLIRTIRKVRSTSGEDLPRLAENEMAPAHPG